MDKKLSTLKQMREAEAQLRREQLDWTLVRSVQPASRTHELTSRKSLDSLYQENLCILKVQNTT